MLNQIGKKLTCTTFALSNSIISTIYITMYNDIRASGLDSNQIHNNFSDRADEKMIHILRSIARLLDTDKFVYIKR